MLPTFGRHCVMYVLAASLWHAATWLIVSYQLVKYTSKQVE